MAALTPTERLEWVLNQSEFEEVHLQIEELLVTYSNFLRRTELAKSELISRFEENGREWTKESYDFGDLISGDKVHNRCGDLAFVDPHPKLVRGRLYDDLDI